MSFQQFCDEKLKEKSINLPPIDMKLFELMLSVCDSDDSFCIDRRRIMCMPCSKYFDTFSIKNGRTTVKDHLNSIKHINNSSNNSNKRKSSENLSVIGTSAKVKSKDFAFRLNSAFMSADIPLNKLDNEVLRSFLFHFTESTIPRLETTIRICE